MRRAVRYLRKKSEAYHMLIHVLLGIICAFVTKSFFPQSQLSFLILYGVLGNLLPDVDHFLFFLLYGRHTEYSKSVKSLFRKKQFRRLWKFISINHKAQTGLYSHNIISIILAGLAFWYFEAIRDRPSLTAFFLSWTTHYIFDIFEDLLFFKTLNPNWYMKFNHTSKRSYTPVDHKP